MLELADLADVEADDNCDEIEDELRGGIDDDFSSEDSELVLDDLDDDDLLELDDSDDDDDLLELADLADVEADDNCDEIEDELRGGIDDDFSSEDSELVLEDRLDADLADDD